MMTTSGDGAPLAEVRRAVAAYEAARKARDDAIILAAMTLSREAAAKASGLSLSRIQQLISWNRHA